MNKYLRWLKDKIWKEKEDINVIIDKPIIEEKNIVLPKIISEDPQLHRMADLSGEARRRAFVHPISAGIPEQMASYVVYIDGTTIYAKNGHTGQIDYSGTDASTVINNALSNLTSGRTWKEKVTLKGNFTIGTKISVPSYTNINIQGKLTLSNNVNDSMFGNTEASLSLPSNIEFDGGILDGNKANNVGGTQYQYLIDAGFATKLTVKNMLLQNFNHMAIRFAGWAITEFHAQGRKPSENIAENNVIEDGGSGVTANDCGIMVTAVSSLGSVIRGNLIRNINGGGILLEDRTNHIVVSNNVIWRVQQHGIFGWYTYDNEITNNIVAEASYSSGASAYFGIGGHCRHHIIKGNIVYGACIGIGIDNDNIQGLGMFNEIEGNTVWDNGNASFAGYGCTIRGGVTYKAEYNKIHNNFFNNTNAYDNFSITLEGQTFTDYKTNYQNYGISFDANCLNNEVIGNNLLGNTIAKIETPTGASIIKDNVGYITENNSIATILSGTALIAVNLSGVIVNTSGSPTTVIVSVITSGYGDRFYYPSNFNSGSFTIYTPNNTSAAVLLSYHTTYNP